MLTKRCVGTWEFKQDAPEGAFTATIATLNAVDKDLDVTIPGAFRDGQAIRISAWQHDWKSLPVGRGVIHADQQRAWVDGRFFLDTAAGRDTYNTVKGLAELQEWSYGYDVLAKSFGKFGDQDVRFLRSLDVIEACPVMIGAGVGTQTDAIKAARPEAKYLGGADAANGSYEALSQELADAFSAQQGSGSFAYAVATFGDHFIACLISDVSMGDGGDRESYWSVPYVLNADGAMTLGNAVKVDPQVTYVPAKGMPYEIHTAQALVAVRGVVDRTRAGSVLRVKEGRAISQARRERMAGVSGSLREAADEIDAMLKETEPAPKAVEPLAKGPSLLRLRADAQQQMLRIQRSLGAYT